MQMLKWFKCSSNACSNTCSHASKCFYKKVLHKVWSRRDTLPNAPWTHIFSCNSKNSTLKTRISQLHTTQHRTPLYYYSCCCCCCCLCCYYHHHHHHYNYYLLQTCWTMQCSKTLLFFFFLRHLTQNALHQKSFTKVNHQKTIEETPLPQTNIFQLSS